MKKLLTLTTVLFCLIFSNLNAQVSINTDGEAPDGTAMLDITSTSKGLLIPRMSESQRGDITLPATGLLVYQTNSITGFYYYNGSGWILIGSGAEEINDLSDGITGGNSIFLGSGSGDNDDGTNNNNSAIGINALAFSESGAYNSTIGTLSLYTNSSGNNNSAVGYKALYGNVSGSNNTSIGYQTLMFSTGSNNTAVGFESALNTTSGTNNVAIGYQALYSNLANNGSTSIGYQSMYYADSRASSGQSTYNTAVGYEALKGSTSTTNNTGRWNTALGYQSLFTNKNGDANVAIGYLSMHSNQSGDYNISIGNGALQANVTGSYNVGIGHSSLNSNLVNSCVAVGYNSLANSTTGYYNTASGRGSLSGTTTGNQNIGIGYNAGDNNTSGGLNTFIGSLTDPSSGSLSNVTALGYNTSVDATNNVAIGNTSVTWIGGEVNWLIYSDSRMKENVREDVVGLDFINKLRPVTYNINKDKIDALKGVVDSSKYTEKYNIEKIKFSGFLAQEVESAALESNFDFSGVRTPENNSTPYSLSYAEFVVPLVKAVQEQQDMIELLKDQNKLLVERIEALEGK